MPRTLGCVVALACVAGCQQTKSEDSEVFELRHQVARVELAL